MVSSEMNKEVKLLLFVFVFTLVFSGAELAAGVISHSLLLIEESVHMFADSVSFGISLWAEVVQQNHGYTKSKAERANLIGSGISLMTLTFTMVAVFVESIKRLVNLHEHGIVVDSTYMLVFGVVLCCFHLFCLTMYYMGFSVHNHGHSHTHDHSHAHDHGHSHGGVLPIDHGHSHGGVLAIDHGHSHGGVLAINHGHSHEGVLPVDHDHDHGHCHEHKSHDECSHGHSHHESSGNSHGHSHHEKNGHGHSHENGQCDGHHHSHGESIPTVRSRSPSGARQRKGAFTRLNSMDSEGAGEEFQEIDLTACNSSSSIRSDSIDIRDKASDLGDEEEDGLHACEAHGHSHSCCGVTHTSLNMASAVFHIFIDFLHSFFVVVTGVILHNVNQTAEESSTSGTIDAVASLILAFVIGGGVWVLFLGFMAQARQYCRRYYVQMRDDDTILANDSNGGGLEKLETELTTI